MRMVCSSVKWKTLSTSYSTCKLQWSMRTHIIIHVDQRLGIMGENSKLAGLPIGKKPNIQVFFFNIISINGFKEQLSPTFC